MTALDKIAGGASATCGPPSGKFSHLPATLLPWSLLLGFLILAGLLFGDQLKQGKPVEVDRVVSLRSPSSETAHATSETTGDPWEGAMLFQAAGWIEPDPLPIKATALVSGVVESVHILEGESVEKGQLLATLIRDDYELNLATAKSQLATLTARAEAHESAIRAAEARIVSLEARVRAGRKKCAELEDRFTRLSKVGQQAVSIDEIRQAELRLETHASEVDALEVSAAELDSEVERLRAMRQEYAAQIQQAETEVARRELALSRTQVHAPVDGIVLRRLAVPGQKRMLEMDDPDSATVAVLYDPEQLQARIDVPLEEAAQLALGQPVRLRSNFLPNQVFKGTVTRIVGQADLQRNTLQAKVRVENPDHRLRPDMLCRAEFLAAAGGDGITHGTASSTSSRLTLYVNRNALVEDGDGSAQVWRIDTSGEHITRNQVELGDAERDGYIAVRSGLKPGDRVVLNPNPDLREGDRVQINDSI